jgi:hypothetical protein
VSDTPKTDAFEALVIRPVDWWDFARELERENAALRADKERLDWLDAKIVSSWLDGEDFVVWDKSSPQPCSIREWLDAARKEAQP